MVTIPPVKFEGHQELPFRIALDNSLLRCHGSVLEVYL